jgi:hypothetical protein
VTIEEPPIPYTAVCTDLLAGNPFGCSSLEFYRAAEVVDIGRELAPTVLDELEKPTPES